MVTQHHDIQYIEKLASDIEHNAIRIMILSANNETQQKDIMRNDTKYMTLSIMILRIMTFRIYDTQRNNI